MNVILQEVYDFAMSMCVELVFVACFAFGFGLLRIKGARFAKPSTKLAQQFKVIHSEAASGNSAKAIAAWRSSNTHVASSCETLKIITQAFLDSEPKSLVAELVEHLALHAWTSDVSKSAAPLLEVVAKAGNEEIMESLFQALTHRLRISAATQSSTQMHEVMLGGHAAAGNEQKVTQLVARMLGGRQKVTARGYSLMIKGFLKNGMLDAALKQIQDMHANRWKVPSFAVTELFRVARACGRTAEVFRSVCEQVPTTADAVAIVLEDCLQLQDISLAKDVEKHTRQAQIQMTFPAYETLLKIYISAGDMHALELFEEMQTCFSFFSNGLCISLISRCAESKFVRFAEAIVAFQRSRGKMCIVAYSALMKVYAYSNMFTHACDLYDQLLADGLEPDSVMYGCLMKFSAECGRTDLTRKLFSKAPGHDVHHHMAMIRAAGQDKDVDKAFAILDDMRSSGMTLDSFACNSVIDVCSSVGDMHRARGLVAEMRKQGSFDMITYNTLLKGYTSCGDVRGAKQVIAEMEEVGLEPNDISYNSLINMAASAGDFSAAWETIETMERKRVRIDHYTVSTIMKALKRSQGARDSVGKVMALLDRHAIDLCSEEVLLNTVVEACCKHGEHKRLSNILAHVDSKRPSMHFAMHTYGNMIRACGILKRVNRCLELWKDMTEVRGLEPSGVTLGCMLDALVCSGRVVEAVALLRKWENSVPGNTVIYSTLIKGFSNIHDAKRAHEMWEELLSKKLPLSTVVYNAIIDAHAKLGDVVRVTELVESMKASDHTPDDITWSMVAKAYCVAGEVDKAFKVFRSLATASSRPWSKSDSKLSATSQVVMFNTILDGCVRHNCNDLADSMLKNMQQYDVRPTNFTLGIIVKMCGRRYQLQRAFEAVKTLPKQYGFTPNAPVQTCLFFACLRNNALDSATKVFQEHRAAGNPPDVKMIGALVSSCARAGRLDQAVALVEETYGLTSGAQRLISSGEDVDFSCLEQLMRSLSRQGLMQKVGVPLLKKMRASKVSHCSRLMAASLAEGQKI